MSMSKTTASYMRTIGRGRDGYNVLHDAAEQLREKYTTAVGDVLSTLELKWM